MHNYLRLYNSYVDATFLERINRFTALVKINNHVTRAYLANTGRLEEHLIPGNKVFLTKIETKKFNYKIISTFYQDEFVLIDTRKINTIFFKIIKDKKLPLFNGIKIIKEEYKIENRRFDLFVEDKIGKNIIELKSCTLCHNRVAMFPDAPSRRASEHILLLSKLSDTGFKSWFIFVIPNLSAKVFIPNLHTDYEFTKNLLNHQNVNFQAVSTHLIDPITINTNKSKIIPIDYNTAERNLSKRGSYVLILKNGSNINFNIGKLKYVNFQPGYYVYVGSAMNNLDKRVARHRKKSKKLHWHIDYITPYHMDITKVFKIRRIDPIENKLAEELSKISDNSVPGFGATDSRLNSHLFYFKNNPVHNSRFISIILDFKSFTK